MNDPLRLLDEGASDVERDLLRAGMDEEPSQRSMKRAAAAVGLALGASAVLPGTAAASAATKVGLWTALHWVGVGLAVAGGVSLGVYVLSSGDGSREVAPVAVNNEASSVSTDILDGIRVEEGPAELELIDSAKTPAPAVRHAPKTAPAEPLDPAASIREQTAMIDSARQKLRSGNPGGAVTDLDRYHRAFPRGVFGQEAVLLRIEALSRSGNRAAARDLAQRFLAGKPSSQYRKRIEALVGPIGN